MTRQYTEPDLASVLKSLGACKGSVEWAQRYGTDRLRAWQECPRADWLLWLLGRLNQGGPWSDLRKPLVACCLDVAATVQHLWPQQHRASMADAVAVLRRWTNGQATTAEAQQARTALLATYYAAAFADAVGAAFYAGAAAYALAVAYAVANPDSSDADADVAAAVARRAIRAMRLSGADRATLAKAEESLTGIVRQHFPQPPEVKP